MSLPQTQVADYTMAMNTNQPLISTRLLFLLTFLTCTGLMAFGFYLDHVLGLEPCPLCMTQRLFFVLCGSLGLLAFFHKPHKVGQRLYAGLIALAAAAGTGFASRHLWLQSLPPEEAPACGPSLEYMFDALPFGQAFELLLKGDGNCAEVTWTLLGISIPGWALMSFLGLVFVSLYLIVTAKDQIFTTNNHSS